MYLCVYVVQKKLPHRHVEDTSGSHRLNFRLPEYKNYFTVALTALTSADVTPEALFPKLFLT